MYEADKLIIPPGNRPRREEIVVSPFLLPGHDGRYTVHSKLAFVSHRLRNALQIAPYRNPKIRESYLWQQVLAGRNCGLTSLSARTGHGRNVLIFKQPTNENSPYPNQPWPHAT